MRMSTSLALASACVAMACSAGAAEQERSAAVAAFVEVDAPVVAVVGARLVDGTGAPPVEHATVIFRGERIAAAGRNVAVPAGARVVDGKGKTLIPGLVGTHDHLFYASGPTPDGYIQFREQWLSFPRLYLAGGVTTLRTAGSVEPYADLNLASAIERGAIAGPALDVTAPYLTGRNDTYLQMAVVRDARDARETVDFWADRGATSFKLYTDVTREVATAAIAQAHKRGLRITGHLCTVGYRDAAQLGIDSLEHGLFADSEFDPNKAEGDCPSLASERRSVLAQAVDGPEIQATIRELIRHHVAISSTLPVFESFGSRPVAERVLSILAPEIAAEVRASKARFAASPNASSYDALLRKEMQFERAFVRAGGLLTTGPDPTGFGGVVAGFGDQRGIELLVEAGFTPVEALRIATRNGAELLGRPDVGTLTPGKQADAVLIDGDPTTRIDDIEKPQIVFKRGVGYSVAKLLASVRGVVGRR
jgi:imidazolonepropionase-like amidohydrolase